jgi:hypothetical protein
LEPNIEQDERRSAVFDGIKGRCTVCCRSNGITVVLENAAYEIANVGLIVDYQHLKRH